jgi:outer membrane protein OmpA-like peptidoglycan-associated protein
MKTLDERIAAADTSTGLEPAMATSGEEKLRSFVVPFAFDSAAQTDGAGETVEAVAQLAKGTDDVRISVGGHADRAGTDPYNERLSMRRAEALTQALVEKGIPADRIQVGAYGERRPVVPTGDGVPEMHNRRVEVTVGSAADF